MTRLVIFLSSSDQWHISVYRDFIYDDKRSRKFSFRRKDITTHLHFSKAEGQGWEGKNNFSRFFFCVLHLRCSSISYPVSGCWCRAQVLDKYWAVPASSSSTRCPCLSYSISFYFNHSWKSIYLTPRKRHSWVLAQGFSSFGGWWKSVARGWVQGFSPMGIR